MTDAPHLTLVSDGKKPRRKGAPKPARATDASTELDRKLAEAFREQESDICDLLTMANITDNLDSEGERLFAIGHLRDMIDEFRRNWYESHKKGSGKAHVGDRQDDEDDAS
jgi:hypothetical protein